MPPSAQPAAQEAPTSSVPTRIATATRVDTCSQLRGRSSAACCLSEGAIARTPSGPEPDAQVHSWGGNPQEISTRLILLALFGFQGVVDIGDRAAHLV